MKKIFFLNACYLWIWAFSLTSQALESVITNNFNHTLSPNAANKNVRVIFRLTSVVKQSIFGCTKLRTKRQRNWDADSVDLQSWPVYDCYCYTAHIALPLSVCPFCTIKIQLSRSLCNPSSKLSLFGYQHFWMNTEISIRTLLHPTMVSYNFSQFRFKEFANRIWALDLNFSAWPGEASKKRETETKWNNLIKFYPDVQIQFLGVTKVSRWHNSILMWRRYNCLQSRQFYFSLVSGSS